MTKAWQIFKIATLLSAINIPKNQSHLTRIAKEVGKNPLISESVLEHVEKKTLKHQSRDKVNLLNQGYWRQTRTFSSKVEESRGKDYLITNRGQNELKLIGKGFMPIIKNEFEYFLVEKNEENLLLVKENKLEIIEERKDMYFSCLEGNDKRKFDFVVNEHVKAGAISVPFHLGKQGKKYAAQFLLEKVKIQSINNELYPKS